MQSFSSFNAFRYPIDTGTNHWKQPVLGAWIDRHCRLWHHKLARSYCPFLHFFNSHDQQLQGLPFYSFTRLPHRLDLHSASYSDPQHSSDEAIWENKPQYINRRVGWHQEKAGWGFLVVELLQQYVSSDSHLCKDRLAFLDRSKIQDRRSPGWPEKHRELL